MAFVVSKDGGSNWGRPIAVFTDKNKMKAFLENDFKDSFNYYTFTYVNIKESYNSTNEYYYVRVESENENGQDCIKDYEVFQVGEIDRENGNYNSLF